MVTANSGHLLVVRPMQSVLVFLLSLFLLLLLNTLSSEVLLELTFLNSVFVFSILERDLGLLLEVGELISVLEHEMHESLHVDLNLDLLLLLQIL
jgi:hypothetical protein